MFQADGHHDAADTGAGEQESKCKGALFMKLGAGCAEGRSKQSSIAD